MNAMDLVQKNTNLKVLRNNGCDSFLEEVLLLFAEHDSEVPNMVEIFVLKEDLFEIQEYASLLFLMFNILIDISLRVE